MSFCHQHSLCFIWLKFILVTPIFQVHQRASYVLRRELGTKMGKWGGVSNTGGTHIFKSWNMPPLNKTGDWGSSDDSARFTWMWCALSSCYLLPLPTVSGCLLLQVQDTVFQTLLLMHSLHTCFFIWWLASLCKNYFYSIFYYGYIYWSSYVIFYLEQWFFCFQQTGRWLLGSHNSSMPSHTILDFGNLPCSGASRVIITQEALGLNHAGSVLHFPHWSFTHFWGLPSSKGMCDAPSSCVPFVEKGERKRE